MWVAASFVLVLGFVPCVIVGIRDDIISALAALTLMGTVATLALVTMTVAFQNQAFIDLAVVLVPMSMTGSLAFVRYLERRR